MPSHERLRPATDLLGHVLEGRYELGPQLGAGGSARVFRARDLRIRADVAIKLMDPELEDDPQQVARFMQEARLAARIRDPHLVGALHFGVDGGYRFIVYEYLAGARPLSDLLEQGRVEPPRVCSIALQLLDALDTLHRAGVVHRDVSPNNCLWRRRDDGRDDVLLGDLGCAITLPPHPPVTGAPKPSNELYGTAYYTAPELLAGGPCDHRADLWSVGALMYALLTNREVDTGEPDAPLAIPAPAVLVPTIPGPISEAVMQALAPLDQRHSSAANMSAAIRRALTQPRTRSSMPLWAGIGGMAAAASVAVAITLGAVQTVESAEPHRSPTTVSSPLALAPSLPRDPDPVHYEVPTTTINPVSPVPTDTDTQASLAKPRPLLTIQPSLTWAQVEQIVRRQQKALRTCSDEDYLSVGLRVARRKAHLESVGGIPFNQDLYTHRCMQQVFARLRLPPGGPLAGTVGISSDP